MNENSGIQIAAAGPHHQPPCRSEAHRRIQWPSVLDSGKAGPIAQMSDYNTTARRVAENSQNIFIRQAMKTVASYPPVPQLACQRKAFGDFGHAPMERRIKARHLRH